MGGRRMFGSSAAPSIIWSVLISLNVMASSPPLSDRFPNLIHPTQDLDLFSKRESVPLPIKSDLSRALQLQSPVKDQVDRNVCLSFATMGLLEALLVQNQIARP